MGQGISRKLRERVWRRDQGLCFYCGTHMGLKNPECTLDHVIPKSKGGSNRMWNLVVSCRPCNSEKNDKDPAEEQLAVVLTRQKWSEAYVALGKAIGRARASGDEDGARILIYIQDVVCQTLYGNTRN